jgi:acyl-coenzyme A thioesterase PaaI-like protein
MSESHKSRVIRWRFNLFPAYWGSGAHITYLADDWREVRVKLPLTWRTRNYVGTIFGGSMYGAVDPIYMVMLIRLLGPGYVVWDKGATINFRRPGRSALYACFRVNEEDTEMIKLELEQRDSIERTYQVDLVDKEGTVHATVVKTIYIRTKDST